MDNVENIKNKLSQIEQEAWATVGIIIRWDNDELETLVVKRAIAAGDPWSGDMAFPGGKKMVSDANLRETAKREVMEETGIDLSKAIFLGYFPEVLTSIKPGSTVLPQVYLYGGRPEISLNSELTRYYWVHLSTLITHRGIALVKGKETQVFDLGEDKVWGLTYRMLNLILNMLEH